MIPFMPLMGPDGTFGLTFTEASFSVRAILDFFIKKQTFQYTLIGSDGATEQRAVLVPWITPINSWRG